MSPDLAARRLLMAAYLYYKQDKAIMSDQEYDALSKDVYELWDNISEERQQNLGGCKESMLATGFHFNWSNQCKNAALQWHEEQLLDI